MRAWYNERPAWQRANEKGHIQGVRDFCFFIEDKGVTTPYWVPESYIDDGASVPRPLWSLPGIGSPFDPLNAEMSFAHDPFYLTHAVSRAVADEVGFQLWRQSGNSLAASRTKWAAIRAGAWWAWNNTEADRKDLFNIRAMIRQRPDAEKFKSLWFAEGNE